MNNNVFFTPNYITGEKLKFRFFSDLHLEFCNNFTIPNLDPDEVIIIAGDISDKGRAIPFLKSIADQGIHLIAVTGNHDYYLSHIDKVDRLFQELDDENPFFHFLNNSSVFINDVEFLGGTLWSSLDNSNPRVYLQVGDVNHYNTNPHAVNDYKKIKINKNGNYSKIKTLDTVKLHIKTVDYIKSRVGEHKKQVVVTHHAPSEIFIDSTRWNNGLEKYTYFSNLESLAEHFDFWIAGHTHLKVNKRIKNTLFLSNPRGYLGTGDTSDVVHDFQLDWQFHY